METAIGVFASRDHAEAAVKELQGRGVPQESIVFLTRSESEAKNIAREFGAYVGGFVGGAAGMTTGVVAASLLLPGIGTVFALGFGAAALLGVAGAGAGATVSSAATHDANAPQPTAAEKASEDVAFFREVLKEGRSLIVVRTESKELAASACAFLTGVESECWDRPQSRCTLSLGRSAEQLCLTSAEELRRVKETSFSATLSEIWWKEAGRQSF